MQLIVPSLGSHVCVQNWRWFQLLSKPKFQIEQFVALYCFSKLVFYVSTSHPSRITHGQWYLMPCLE